MKELVRVTRLAAPCERVWERVITPEGINYELFPFLKMTMPERMQGKGVRDVPVGERLGRSWLLLLGILPFDFDDIVIAEMDPGHRFLEMSSMLSMERWEHERTLALVGGGCAVRDRIRFELRKPLTAIPLLEPFVLAIVTRLFQHRHRRLMRWFGSDA